MQIPVIEIKDLTKVYDDKCVVDHLNLTIYEGEVFGLLGPNGAGKSTTILMLLGLTEPTAGSVRINGIDATYNPVEVKRRVGYLPEDVGFYDNMTGIQNLIYTALLNGFSYDESEKKATQLLQKVGLWEEAHKKVGKYSRGMRQRLGLADVLIKNPSVIILDEPTLGIDPSGMKDFLNLIISLSKEDKITVLFSSHHLHQVQQVCDRVGIFVGGKLIAHGNIEQLSQQIFSNGNFVIEVAFENILDIALLKEYLKHYKTIKKIEKLENNFLIESTQDIVSDLACTLIEKDLKLCYLNRKKYGLDEIYQRYFI